MKKLFFIITALLMTGIANAQSNKEEVDFIQSIYGMEKKALVADFMDISDANKDAFWKLYDEYEVKRKELGKQRIDLLEQYADNYSNMSPEIADKWMADVIKLSTATDKHLITYYKKIKKATDPVTALKFWHVETYILTSVRQAIVSEIPFVKSRK
jgi:hypothetical protein